MHDRNPRSTGELRASSAKPSFFWDYYEEDDEADYDEGEDEDGDVASRRDLARQSSSQVEWYSRW